MFNPLENEVPEGQLARVHDLARDLAYGAVDGRWGTTFSSRGSRLETYWGFIGPLTAKWGEYLPPISLLVSLGYMERIDNVQHILTEKAFKLLEQPPSAPKVFISYRRQDSSAFALLIEARLRMTGNAIPFVDKAITPGEKWHDFLEEQVKSADYFVLLVGPTTLDSKHVREEISWAEMYECRIVSIWQPDVDRSSANRPAVLDVHQAITVRTESAEGYEVAVSQLLNAMGYATY